MNTLLLLARLGLFALSLAGWCLWAARRFALPVEQTPLVTISAIGCAMCGAGLLNILTPVRGALTLGGLAALVWVLVRQRAALTPWLSLRGAAFPVLSAWLLVLTRGGLVPGHDNFAHWAIMAKTVITQAQLPNTANTAVEFVGYPPATACWIDYVCGTVGLSDGMMMFSQGLLVLAGAWALWGLCPKKCPGGWLAAAGAMLVLAGGNVPLADLRVDTLLAALGAGALAVVLALRYTPEKAALAALPCLSFLALVKNSGLFFIACVLAVLWYWLARGSAPRAAKLKAGLACTAVPFAAYWLWLRHVALVYPAGASSKHAVSLGSYETILGDKTAEELARFNGLFRSHLLSLSEGDTRRMLAFAVLLILVCLFVRWYTRCSLRAVLLPAGACLGAELAYIGCLWGTYVFSMNTNEMLVLASIQRYHTTTLQFLAAALAAWLLLALPKGKAGGALPAAAGAAVLALGAAFCLAGNNGLAALVSRAPYQDPDNSQQPVLALKQEYGLTDGSRYLFYTRGGDVDTWSLRYVARYVLNTNTAKFWQYEDEWYTLEELYENYDYLILLSRDEEIEAFLAENGLNPSAECIHLTR